MQLKESVGATWLMQQAATLSELAVRKLQASSNIVLLGNKNLPHLPTYSMVIRHSISGFYLCQFFQHELVPRGEVWPLAEKLTLKGEVVNLTLRVIFSLGLVYP
jgi:hypothetical protein